VHEMRLAVAIVVIENSASQLQHIPLDDRPTSLLRAVVLKNNCTFDYCFQTPTGLFDISGTGDKNSSVRDPTHVTDYLTLDDLLPFQITAYRNWLKKQLRDPLPRFRGAQAQAFMQEQLNNLAAF
jgi:hypothetical protein